MKLIFVVFSFISLVCIETKAQEAINYNIKVNYNINYNTEIPNTKKGVLYIDSSNYKSIFVYGEDEDQTIEQRQDNDGSFIIKLKGITKFNYLNLLADSLFSKEKAINNEFIIHEKTPNFNWKLENEEKKIDEILVKKATLNFRGRNYIAWYCETYPIKFGPWKFYGLPGMIIEIYDETMRYHWVVSSILKQEKKSILINSLFSDTKRITLKEYVNLRYDNKSILNKARLPRDIKVISTEIPRNGIEIKFEWEEDVKED